jgi:hypothetical protein
MIVFWFQPNCELTAEQHRQLTDVLMEKAELDTGLEMLVAEKQIARIEKEDLPFINEKQWKELGAVLGLMGRG